MTKYQEEHEQEAFDAVFHALADATRRAMVERLSRGPATVSALAALFEHSMPTVMQHLRVLEDAGVVSSSKVGRVRTCQLVPGSLGPAIDWMAARRTPAEAQMDRLAEHLDREARGETAGPDKEE